MTGVPRSALVGRFIQVRPELITVCGGAAEAIIVSLVDYRTSPEHRSALIDGENVAWWPATIPEFSDATGLTQHQARYAVRKAVERGLLSTTEHHPRGDNYDRTKSYRVNYSTAQGANLPQVNLPAEGGKSAPSGGANLPLPTFYEEPIEEVEEEDCASDDASVAVIVDPFDEFWDAYPIRKGKKPAREAYERALKRATPETILAGLHAYVRSLTPRTTVKWAQGWLNDDRWTDEYSTPAALQAVPGSGGRPLSAVERNAARMVNLYGGGGNESTRDGEAAARGIGGR